MDEFQSIARLFRPLTNGAPEALDLLDDAAVISSRPGFDLVITKDAMVEGVHFLPDDPPGLIAQKLLRVNLSDLAAKGAEPYGYFLAAAWPGAWNEARRAAFAAGLQADQATYGLSLFGGDTVSTPGPLTLSATLLGWVPAGGVVKRSGARAGDAVLVSGTIGDGALGLLVARGQLADASDADQAYLADRYRLPRPRVELQGMLRAFASAAADVSDGLLADARHIGEASGLGVEIDLNRVPLSAEAGRWLDRQADRQTALMHLASGGDDYEIVCTMNASRVDRATAEAQAAGLALTPIGKIMASAGLSARYEGRSATLLRTGWTHP